MAEDSTGEHENLRAPELMTQPGWSFQKEHERLFAFVIYVTHLATSTDEKAKVAARALYEQDDPDKYRETLENIEKHGATQVLRHWHGTLVLEMMLCRAADNFLVYITELLAVVFRTRPETLRSSETVRLDAILKHSTMEALVHDLAERRVNRLSYQGMRDLAEYLTDRLSFDLFPKPDDLERAVRIIESRNLIVHNRGIVNDVFLSRVPSTTANVGNPIGLNTDQIFDDFEFIALSVYQTDDRAVQKFSLSAIQRPDNVDAA